MKTDTNANFSILYEQYMSDLEELILKKNEYASQLEKSKQYYFKQELKILYGVFKLMDELKAKYDRDINSLFDLYQSKSKDFISMLQAYQTASSGEEQFLKMLLKEKKSNYFTSKPLAV